MSWDDDDDDLELVDEVDWSDPVNKSHDLNRSIEAWYLSGPGGLAGFGTTTWRDLCRTADGVLTNMTASTDWAVDSNRPGGWGYLGFGNVAANKRVIITNTTLTNLPLNNFTVSFWASGTHTAANSVAIAWNGTDDLVIYPYDTDSGNGARVFWRDLGGAIVNENSVTRTGWNHFLFTTRGSTDHQFFVNGISVGTSSASRAGAGPFSGLWLGGFADDVNQRFDSGRLDSVRLLSRGYTASEAWDLYIAERSYYPGLLNRIRRRTISAPAAGTFQSAWASRSNVMPRGVCLSHK